MQRGAAAVPGQRSLTVEMNSGRAERHHHHHRDRAGGPAPTPRRGRSDAAAPLWGGREAHRPLQFWSSGRAAAGGSSAGRPVLDMPGAAGLGANTLMPRSQGGGIGNELNRS